MIRMNYIVFTLAAIIMVSSSCHRKVVVVRGAPAAHRLPPGQTKKITGAKSAKAYAPGQQKKH
jgi:hypothetical protein